MEELFAEVDFAGAVEADADHASALPARPDGAIERIEAAGTFDRRVDAAGPLLERTREILMCALVEHFRRAEFRRERSPRFEAGGSDDVGAARLTILNSQETDRAEPGDQHGLGCRDRAVDHAAECEARRIDAE